MLSHICSSNLCLFIPFYLANCCDFEFLKCLGVLTLFSVIWTTTSLDQITKDKMAGKFRISSYLLMKNVSPNYIDACAHVATNSTNFYVVKVSK